jgi:hypothetical protein
MKKLLTLILLVLAVTTFSQNKDERIVKFETKKVYVTKYIDRDSVVITPKIRRCFYFVIYNPDNPSLDTLVEYLVTDSEKVAFDAKVLVDEYDEVLKDMVEQNNDIVYGKGIIEKVILYKNDKIRFFYVSHFKKINKKGGI